MNGYRYVFGDFEVDPANRICLRSGEQVPLTGRIFDILVVFAENPGRLLTKDELIEKVWGDDFVEDGNVARNVSTLRKALREDSKEPKYIATVQGRGYRFIAEVVHAGNANGLLVEPNVPPVTVVDTPNTMAKRKLGRTWVWAIPVLTLLVVATWLARERFFTPRNQIKTLAVLPLKSLNPEDNYLGIGIADAVIRKISETGQVTVRPTSATFKYAKDNTDSLTAARELNTDAILEGTVQRSGERLRVTVNLLRASDGTSLWSDNFDLSTQDIFAIEDNLAQQVSSRLQLRLDPNRSAHLGEKYPTDPAAYESYVKGILSLDERGYGEEGMSRMQTTIAFFKKAIEVDPNYALAHAELAFAYVWTALFIDAGNSKWADLAREEIERSQELGPNLAETHLAKALLLWSAYDGYQNEAAIRELLLAKLLNPNVANGQLAATYAHIGLEDIAARELQRDLAIDPTSQSLKDLTLILPYLKADPDEWLAARQKTYPPDTLPPWYFLQKGDLSEAQKSIAARLPIEHSNHQLLIQQALLFALKGQHQLAQQQVSGILAKIQTSDQNRHHSTYLAACIYALAGDAPNAVKWLRETANTGYPNYPLFARDRFLDRIRQTPEFRQFIAEQKTQWERCRQEFGD